MSPPMAALVPPFPSVLPAKGERKRKGEKKEEKGDFHGDFSMFFAAPSWFQGYDQISPVVFSTFASWENCVADWVFCCSNCSVVSINFSMKSEDDIY